MTSPLFNLLAGSSLLLLVATVAADFSSHDANRRHWVYFATFGTGPAFVDGVIEFGSLGTSQPFVPATRSLGLGFSWSGSHEYGLAAKSREFHDIDDNFARRIVWHIGTLKEIAGRIIPPWGWKGGQAEPWGVPTVAIPYKEFDFPIIYLMPLFALAPAFWFNKLFIYRSRSSSGLCPNCGYDLRASPNRCPECGTVATKAST